MPSFNRDKAQAISLHGDGAVPRGSAGPGAGGCTPEGLVAKVDLHARPREVKPDAGVHRAARRQADERGAAAQAVLVHRDRVGDGVDGDGDGVALAVVQEGRAVGGEGVQEAGVAVDGEAVAVDARQRRERGVNELHADRCTQACCGRWQGGGTRTESGMRVWRSTSARTAVWHSTETDNEALQPSAANQRGVCGVDVREWWQRGQTAGGGVGFRGTGRNAEPECRRRGCGETWLECRCVLLRVAREG